MRARRDPRAELQARLVAGVGRLRFALVPIRQPATARPRRDPRARRRAATVISGAKPRIDWQAGRVGAASSAIRADAGASQPRTRIIAEPAYLVLAVPDLPEGALSDHDREMLCAARQFADSGGGAVVVLAVEDVAGLAEAGADRVMSHPVCPLGDYDPEGRVAVVRAVIDTLKPQHVLFPESGDGGADLARRVAALSGERLFAAVETIADGRVSRRMRGGVMEATGVPCLLMSIAANAFSPQEGPPHEARALETPDAPTDRRIESAVPLAIEAGCLALSDADFILSGGNGVTNWPGFIELGHALGATLGGSRVVCDEGHLPRDRQVGASGTVVTARCYLAFGIAGAPQHLQGITEVQHVVAVNTDLHAEMIKRADLAIIADTQQVIPALIRHARERRNG
jgi:electron transfer flavoprotein alpha subunit